MVHEWTTHITFDGVAGQCMNYSANTLFIRLDSNCYNGFFLKKKEVFI